MKEITFDDIQRANEAIKTTDIKGKDYAEVNQRIKAFRMVYPQGTIETKMMSNENGICIFKAYVFNNIHHSIVKLGANEDDDLKDYSYVEKILLATGTAYEKENSTFINKTSYIENCETSAVGRALGMAGFGIDTSVASAEEVQNAIANQEFEDSLVSDTEAKVIYKALMKKLGSNDEVIAYLEDKYGINNTSQLMKSQYVEIVKEFK